MELLVLKDFKLVRYSLSYDEITMREFLRHVIQEYGIEREMSVKVKQESDINNYCDEFKDLKLIKTIEDNSKIHKGRKRVTRKPSPVKYLYSFTAIEYPEIYYTIMNFLQSDFIDFNFFSKYIEPYNNINYNDINYYIEDNYERHGINDFLMLKKILKDDEVRRAYINVTTSKREQQGKCLKDFYELFTLNFIEEKEIKYVESLDIMNRMYESLNSISSICGYIGPVDYLLKPQVTSFEISLARKNNDVIEKIENLTTSKVKTK